MLGMCGYPLWVIHLWDPGGQGQASLCGLGWEAWGPCRTPAYLGLVVGRWEGGKKKELKDCIGCESLGERFGAKGDDLFPYKKGELKSSKNLPNHRGVTMGKGNEATKKNGWVGWINEIDTCKSSPTLRMPDPLHPLPKLWQSWLLLTSPRGGGSS